VKQFWAQLKPGERRWVAAVGVVVFLVLNWILVWPHFSDWKKADARMQKAHDMMNVYSAEIKNRSSYEAKINALQSDGGSEVVQDDQAIDLVRFYSSRATSNEVQVINNSRPTTSTNDPFFVNHEIQLSVQGRENHLVDFLYSLGAGNSIVRVRAMSLRPDSTHQQINANISIVASYAKKPPVRNTISPTPKAVTPKPAAPAIRPVVQTQTQTNKSMVTITHSHAATNKPVPLTAKRP
jgi:hypothetical protein